MTYCIGPLFRWRTLSIGTLTGALIFASVAARSEEAKPAAPDTPLIEKGEYLARAGDCVACHTAPEGKLFAGGLAMPTPFGTLYTSNITPDRETGIGAWTADQFYATMHTGRFPDGGLIYPAMPFGSYTKVTRQDSDAIFAYLQIGPAGATGEPAARSAIPLQQPLADPGLAHAVFQRRRVQARPRPSPPNGIAAPISSRGSAIAACATPPINALGGSSESQAFQGGLIPMQNWYAPSLTSNKEAGLGDWSIEGHR